jgi:splicing suppressor protein 51
MRIFILGARAESSLPPHVWEQLTRLFPSAHFHLFFIGPQVSLPKPPGAERKAAAAKAEAEAKKKAEAEVASSTPAKESPENEASSLPAEQEKPIYLPNAYEPPTPAPIERLKRTRDSIERYGVPSYTVAYTSQLTITGMQANYAEVHSQFQHTLDPYSDCFFFFSPGFGFPSPTSTTTTDTGSIEPLLQIASPTEWGPVLPMILASKCPMFVTGFSPADVERDVKSLSVAPEVAGEFDWVITPGPNTFGSEKWEVADFDPRVMVRTNWGVWGIRGKSRDVRERSSFFQF